MGIPRIWGHGNLVGYYNIYSCVDGDEHGEMGRPRSIGSWWRDGETPLQTVRVASPPNMVRTH
jgi:hypothetical protein